MPIYITATIGATAHTLSTEFLVEASFWDAEVVRVSNLNTALTHDHGGYYKPSFGTVEFLPTPFSTDWPPPQKIDLTIETGADDSSKDLICNGTGTLKSYDQVSVIYDVAGPQFDIADDSKVFSGTLVDAFTWACGAAVLNLTLDTSLARSPSPAISKTNDSEALVIDLMADAAAFFSHAFHIVDGTLFLVDLLDSDATLSLSEFEFTPAKYQGGNAVSLVKGGDYFVTGSDSSGKEYSVNSVWHSTQSNIEAALADIKTIIEKGTITLEVAAIETEVGFNTEVTAFDESLINDITSVFNVHKKNMNIGADRETLIIEGRGTIS